MTDSIAPASLRPPSASRQKSARELGASLVAALHRLLRISLIHAMDNMAVLQQLDQTTEALRIFCSRVQGPATFLFAKNTVFVSGQLLKASRTEYQAALELGATLAAVGVSELVIQPDVENADLRGLAESVVAALRNRENRTLARQPTPKIRARKVDAAALLSDGEDLPNDEQIVRTYAQAIVVMRHVVDTLSQGRFELPHEAKRIAQKLVLLSEGDTPSFLGVTAMRNANHDAAGRAVNASILAVAMCRLLSDDLSLLSRIAMAALLFDVGLPLIVGPERAQAMARLGEEEELRLPAAVAFAHTLLGGFRLPSMVRTVIDFEAHWHPRSASMGPLYAGERSASIAARIVAAAHRFNALLTPDPASRALLTPDEAVTVIESEAKDADDRVVVSLLVGAIGLFPRGTIVELSSGEIGVVIESPSHPAEYVRPRVRVVKRADGRVIEPPRDLDLRGDPTRFVTRIVTAPDERLRACRAELLAKIPSNSPPDSQPPTQPRADAPSMRAADREPPPKSREERRTQPISSAPPTPSSGRRVPWSSLLVHRSTEPEAEERGDVLPSMAVVRPPTVPPSSLPPTARATASGPPRRSSEHAPSTISAIFSLITKNVAATARGTLGKTPLAHLIVYVFERRLTGTLVLTPPDEAGIEQGVYFDAGVPLRIWMPPGVLPLARMLIALGHVDESVLADPVFSIVGDNEPALEGELLRQGVSEDQIAQARDLQLLRGAELLFELPPAASYAFYADRDLVEPQIGAIPGRVSPLELVVTGLRRREEDPTMTRVLERVGQEPLRLVAGLRASGYGFDLDESSAFEALALSAPSLADLTQNPLLDPAASRRVVYVLLLTRAITLGTAHSQRPPIEYPPSSR